MASEGAVYRAQSSIMQCRHALGDVLPRLPSEVQQGLGHKICIPHAPHTGHQWAPGGQHELVCEPRVAQAVSEPVENGCNRLPGIELPLQSQQTCAQWLLVHCMCQAAASISESRGTSAWQPMKKPGKGTGFCLPQTLCRRHPYGIHTNTVAVRHALSSSCLPPHLPAAQASPAGFHCWHSSRSLSCECTLQQNSKRICPPCTHPQQESLRQWTSPQRISRDACCC